MERKIGEIFTCNGKIYQVVKSDICANCAFRENDCSIIRSRIGLCVSSIRFDKTNVVFKEIKMEIKNNQLTIDIPEGMEIDTENSSLAEGIIKFKSKYITYSKIINSFNSMTNTNVYIHSSDTKALKAIARLMNIAKYYNGDWKPNIKQGECCVTCLVKFKNESTELCVYFRNPEGWVCDDMSPKDFKRNFKGWLYIDDLLPKKGD